MQLLQRSIIILKEKRVSDDEKIVIKEALQAQIKCLQIGWELLEELF